MADDQQTSFNQQLPSTEVQPETQPEIQSAAAVSGNDYPTPPVRNEPTGIGWILFGKEGLRAGWSLFIYIAITAALLASLAFVMHKVHPVPQPPRGEHAIAQPMTPGKTIFNEAAPFALILLATWIMSRIEKRPNSVYGLGGGNIPQRFFAGLLWGIVCISLLIYALQTTGHLVFEARLLHGGQAAKSATLWAVGFLCVGLLEEYLMRGYLQFTLARGLAGIYGSLFKTRHRYALGFWTAAILLSFLFGFGHSANPGESPIGELSAGLAGFVFAFSLWRTGSLWWAFGFHAAWDWGQSFLYGVADSGTTVQGHLYATHPVGKALLSGGTTGPEGSIYVLPTLALIALIIFLTLRQAHQPPPGAKLRHPL